MLATEHPHQWNVHFDRLTPYQHEAIALRFDSPQLLAGLPGSGLTTVASFRLAALLQAGPRLKRPRPTYVAASLLRARRMHYLLGPLAVDIDIVTVSQWLMMLYSRATGQEKPDGADIDWVRVAGEIRAAGRPLVASVVVDDAHRIRPEQRLAARMLTENVYFTSHAPNHTAIEQQIGLPASLMLGRRRRQPRDLLQAATAWGATAPGAATDGNRRPAALEAAPGKTGAVLLEVMARRRAERSLRVAVVPMARDQVSKIADFFLVKGVSRRLLFSGDAPFNQVRRWDVGVPGIYVLNPEQLEGLEFDEVYVIGTQHVGEDTASAAVQGKLMAIVNSCCSRLVLSWPEGTPARPALVRKLDEAGIFSARQGFSGA